MKWILSLTTSILLLTIFSPALGYKSHAKIDRQATSVQLPTRGICAHRGASATHPENTLSAFNEAIRLGVQMVELDVQMSKDGLLVVIHDSTLDRTSNAIGPVNEMMRRQLRELDVGLWKGEQFRNERLHRLMRILSVLPDNIWLCINVDTAVGRGGIIKVAYELEMQHRLRQAFVCCSDADMLIAAQEKTPGLKTGGWYNAAFIPTAQTLEEDCVDSFVLLKGTSKKLLSGEKIKSLHDAGFRVGYFGDIKPTDIGGWFEQGVDFIVTDNPASYIQAAAVLDIEPVKPVLLSHPGGIDDHSFRARPSGSMSWRKLASSHHPAVLQGDWRVKISDESQLFIDDYLIHSMKGLTRRINQPAKYEGNPVLNCEKPWEGWQIYGHKKRPYLAANGTIIKDPDSGLWRMYYKGEVRIPCLAISKDLLHWERPVLHQVEYKGSKENNIVINNFNCDLMSVFNDTCEKDSSRRWKASLYHYAGHGLEHGLYAHYSPDGLHWTVDPNPIMAGHRNWPGGFAAWSEAWPMAGLGDVCQVAWDDKLKKYVAHLKIWTWRDDQFVRSRGFSESDDFVHWSEPRMTLIPDEDDPEDVQYYGSIGWPYESMWIGLLRTYHTEVGNVDLRLICSRDGRYWKHVGDRTAFIPNGPEGSYDQGYMTDFSNPPIEIGNELWFFYSGTTTPGKRHKDNWRGGICLAKLKKDRFVSLDAGCEEGWVITRPFTMMGKTLTINADAAGGEVQVEVVDYDISRPPRAIEGFEKKSCNVLNQDDLAQQVSWKNKALCDLEGQLVRLKLYVKNAKLYSFTIK